MMKWKDNVNNFFNGSEVERVHLVSTLIEPKQTESEKMQQELEPIND